MSTNNNETDNMQLPLPKSQSFEAPAGPHRATLIEVKDHFDAKSYKTGQAQLRLVFRLDGLDHEPLEYLAGKNYIATLAEGSDLRHHLDSWLNGDYSSVLGADGNVDFDRLVNRQAEIILSHQRTSKYPKPYRRIDGIYPPGTLGLN